MFLIYLANDFRGQVLVELRCFMFCNCAAKHKTVQR